MIEEHKQIVDAIAAGNPAEAVRCVEKHLAGTLLWIDGMREQYPAYVVN